MNRSGKELCEICSNPEILVTHHINGRKIPDAEKEWNKVNICNNCHRLIHENIIIIEAWFSTTSGKQLLWHYQNEESITGENAKPYIIPKI